MEIVKTINGADACFALTGRLDTTTAPSLDSEVNGIIPNVSSIVFDFANLDYLSSAGLRVILCTQKAMTAKGGKFVIKNVNDTIMDVFDMTGFTSILTIEK
ncbi:MAG: STAS domain-containing protein [Bacilli bacterium]|nr:STAS domain-containing protein [Bacilli bacterium]